MNEAQNSLPANEGEAVSAESAPDRACGLAAEAGGKTSAGFRMDNGSDVGGHTLLSRPAVPQGRRSLFRR